MADDKNANEIKEKTTAAKEEVSRQSRAAIDELRRKVS